jgi:hypothetical protein
MPRYGTPDAPLDKHPIHSASWLTPTGGPFVLLCFEVALTPGGSLGLGVLILP